MFINTKLFLTLSLVLQLSASSIFPDHPESNTNNSQESDLSLSQSVNGNAAPISFDSKKDKSKPDSQIEEDYDGPKSEIKASLVDVASKHIKKTKSEKLQLQVRKLVMAPTISFISGILGAGAKLADKPKINDAIAAKVEESIEGDSDLINIILDSLDTLAKKDKLLGETIRDSFGSKFVSNRALANYVGKISKKVYEKNPEAAKKTISKLLGAHKKHNLLADSLASSLQKLVNDPAPKST